MSGFDGTLFLHAEGKTNSLEFETKGYVSVMESIKIGEKILVLLGYEKGQVDLL